MSEYETILFEIVDRVATITLYRPETLNAFSGGMGHEIQDAYRRCDRDDDIRVVVLTGHGRAFCSGADFSSGPAVFGAPDPDQPFSADPMDGFHAWDVRKPVIAAINGHAIGLGLTIALHCDLRLVARDAKLGIVQSRRGVMPDARAHWTLPRIVGHAKAAEILLTGKTFTGSDALTWGLASEALDADQVLPRAHELAAEIASATAPLSVAVSKRLLWWHPEPDRDRTAELEAAWHKVLMGSADSREGVMAWLEKREPQWSLSVTDEWQDWMDEGYANRD